MKLLNKLNNEEIIIIQVMHSIENSEYRNEIINLKDGWLEQ